LAGIPTSCHHLCVHEETRPDREPTPEREPEPETAYDLLQRGNALLERRHHAQAAIVLERADRLEPDKQSILEALGRAYFNSGQHDQARVTFERLLDIDPSADYAHYALGQSLKRLGRRDDWQWRSAPTPSCIATPWRDCPPARPVRASRKRPVATNRCGGVGPTRDGGPRWAVGADRSDRPLVRRPWPGRFQWD
jgi:tetratricopeptide (TPR) repeat protein